MIRLVVERRPTMYAIVVGAQRLRERHREPPQAVVVALVPDEKLIGLAAVHYMQENSQR